MRSLTAGILGLALFPLLACGGRVVAWDVLDTAPPTVTSTTPAGDATAVALNTTISATFSEQMAPATVNETTFVLEQGTDPVPGVVMYVGVTTVFTPLVNLAPNTLYKATITTGVEDLAGNTMAANYVWSFTTGTELDSLAPWVTATNPLSDATNVPIDSGVMAVFNEAMNPLSVSTATFILMDGTTPVPGTVINVGVSALFKPTLHLDPDTLYTANITTGVEDLAGNAMAANYVWSFRTGMELDTTAPWVTSTNPVTDATEVSINATIIAIFSEAMEPLTISNATYTLLDGDTPVQGSVDVVGVSALFTPGDPLAPNTLYTATITTGVVDLAGNAMAENYVWSFRTGGVSDTTRPLVLSTIPENGELDVTLGTNIYASFSEAMDPLTLTDISFTLMDGLVPVLGMVTPIVNIVTFDPDVDLDPDTEYTATITTAAADLAGNTLQTDYVWNFTTGAAIDQNPPTVISTNPLDLAIEVPLNALVNATFSKDMDPLTITEATFTVTGPAMVEVSGQVLYDPMTRIGTFTPDDDLLPETLYTATITIGAADLAGNAMLEDYVWTFMTGEEILTGILPVPLGSLTTFVAVAGAGLTNSNSGGTTTLNGDVGLSPTGTCLGDGSPCTITNPVINGTLYINDPEGVAAQAKEDLIAAYIDAMTRPVGTTVNDISGMVLEPGVYTSGSTMSVAVGGTVTLDGMGDANSVFIFQIGSSLTVNNNAQVLLINDAKARNVFWAVMESSTLGSNVNFQGNVLAGSSNSVGTGSVVIGRLLCSTGQITLLSNTITLPPL